MSATVDFERELHRAKTLFNAAAVQWAVAAGAGVFLYTGSRIPTDLDLLVPPSQMERAAVAFGELPIEKRTSWGAASHLELGNTEVAGRLSIRIEGQSYIYEMDSEMVSHTRMLEFKGDSVPVLAPEDLIALKLVLQRGPEQGKHDLEDVAALAEAMKIDTDYLRWRLEAMKAEDRAGGLLKRWGW